MASAAAGPTPSAKVFCTSRVDRPRTTPAITTDSNAFDFVTPLPNNCEANASVVPRSLGRATVTGAAVVLIVDSQKPFRLPDRASGHSGGRWYGGPPQHRSP